MFWSKKINKIINIKLQNIDKLKIKIKKIKAKTNKMYVFHLKFKQIYRPHY